MSRLGLDGLRYSALHHYVEDIIFKTLKSISQFEKHYNCEIPLLQFGQDYPVRFFAKLVNSGYDHAWAFIFKGCLFHHLQSLVPTPGEHVSKAEWDFLHDLATRPPQGFPPTHVLQDPEWPPGEHVLQNLLDGADGHQIGSIQCMHSFLHSPDADAQQKQQYEHISCAGAQSMMPHTDDAVDDAGAQYMDHTHNANHFEFQQTLDAYEKQTAMAVQGRCQPGVMGNLD